MLTTYSIKVLIQNNGQMPEKLGLWTGEKVLTTTTKMLLLLKGAL